MELKTVAVIKNDYTDKFAVPRQSGIADNILSEIIFTSEFRDPNYIRGIEDFSHLWLIWGFSENISSGYSPTVRPPKLGGNSRVGVFATRSPFRPNGLGLSSVKIKSVNINRVSGPIITVSGADLKNGTPIYDIKPYIPYSDCHEDATGGFSLTPEQCRLAVNIPETEKIKFSKEKLLSLIEILAQDPRPGYHSDSQRIYGFRFSGKEVKFTVAGDNLTVISID